MTSPERWEDAQSDEGPVRVLIVDDHPVVRAGLKAMLNVDHIDVVGEAPSGQDAVRMTVDLKPDVVLMDVNMPDIDGLEATRQIKEKYPEAAVIIVTGVESNEYLHTAIEAGAVGYLVKGMEREVLVQAVKLVQQGGSLIDASTLSELARSANIGPASEDGTGLDVLSPRELDVLRYVVQGMTNKEIAQHMSYSTGTVKNVMQRIIEKLGVSDRTQAAVYAVRAGIDVE